MYSGKRKNYINKFCVILVKCESKIIYYDIWDKESFNNYVALFIFLDSKGITVLGITSDWHPSCVSAFKYTNTNKPHQRCLVHTTRYCEQRITKKPQTEAGVALLKLVNQLCDITSKSEKAKWLYRLYALEIKYSSFINQTTPYTDLNGRKRWWYTHKKLRQAFRSILKTQDNLFKYLDYNYIRSDTNNLEGEFSHVKQKILNHRGLKKNRKIAVIKWYLFLKMIRR
jgi:hypothetical protein